MEAGALCRFLSLVPVSLVQNTGLPLLKSILPAAHIIHPVVVLPVLPAAIVHPRAVIPAADLICLNTGLHLAAIRAQAGPARPPGPIPAAESLLRVVIQAADLICPNTGLHLAVIQVQADPAPQANPPPPIALIPAVAPLPREGLRFPEVAAGRPVRA